MCSRSTLILLFISLLILLTGCANRQLDSFPTVISSASDAVFAIANQSNSIASGFFVAPNLLITNEHVTKAGTLFLLHADGKRTVLKRVATDETLDIALFESGRFRSPHQLNLARQSPEVGVQVIALGNPFGTGITASAGIVSAKPRAIGKVHLLQTDAAINPGNSGGPLINAQGEVVGLVSSRGAVGSGIGFALPVEWLAPFVEMHRQEQ